MGRTLPSAMMVFDAEASRWSKFRRALRREDQEVFDAIFRGARKHVSAMAYESSAIPLDSILLAMLIESAREVRELNGRVRALEIALAGRGGRDQAEPVFGEAQTRPACPTAGRGERPRI